MRALVTGGGGFIGSHCVDALVARGHEVIVIDSFEPTVHTGSPDYLNPAAKYISADVADEEVLVRALRGVDGVSHQAAVVGLGRGLATRPATRASTAWARPCCCGASRWSSRREVHTDCRAAAECAIRGSPVVLIHHALGRARFARRYTTPVGDADTTQLETADPGPHAGKRPVV